MAGVDKRKAGSLPNEASVSLASASLPPENRLTGGDVEPGTGNHPPTGRLVPAETVRPGVDKRKAGSLPNDASASLGSSFLPPENRLTGGDVEPGTGNHPLTGRLMPAEAAQQGVDKRKAGSLPNKASVSLASSSLPPENRLTGGDVEPGTGNHPPTGRLVPAETVRPAGCPGLVNIGLSCYLNAALQSLAPCQEFVTWLGQYWGRSSCVIINVLYGLIDPTNDQVDPKELQEAFYGRTFRISYQQQDCHEMFQHLMESIEEEISVCDDADKANPFLGKQKVRLRCESCRYEYPTTISSFYSITLNIIPGQQCALVDLLKWFTKQETINNVDCTKCALKQPRTMSPEEMRHQASSSRPMTQTNLEEEQHANDKSTTGDSVYLRATSWGKGKIEELLAHCVRKEVIEDVDCTEWTTKSEAEGAVGQGVANSVYIKQLSLQVLPQCLCIHINKTSIHGTVSFEEDLLLTEALEGIQRRKTYRLVSVVCHHGGLHSGHYITYRLEAGSKSRVWFYTSDLYVYPVSWSRVKASSPYMLMYCQVQDI